MYVSRQSLLWMAVALVGLIATLLSALIASVSGGEATPESVVQLGGAVVALVGVAARWSYQRPKAIAAVRDREHGRILYAQFGADLEGTCAPGGNLANADLAGERLRGAELSGADLSRAELRSADLSEASLVGANLSSANLTGACLASADLRRASLARTVIDFADLSDADLRGANLRGLARGPGLLSASLAGARYDRDTAWPRGFDPISRGCVDVTEPPLPSRRVA